MRLFLDANILFSAAWSEESAANLLFGLATAGCCELYSSRLALEEARYNLRAKRPDRVEALERLIGQLRLGPEPGSQTLRQAGAHGLPDKDEPILAGAIECRADILVTGDRRDFGHLYGHKVEGARILTLAAAVEAIIEL